MRFFEVSADKTIAEDLFVNYTVREYQTDFILPEVARVGIVSLNAGTSSQDRGYNHSNS